MTRKSTFLAREKDWFKIGGKQSVLAVEHRPSLNRVEGFRYNLSALYKSLGPVETIFTFFRPWQSVLPYRKD